MGEDHPVKIIQDNKGNKKKNKAEMFTFCLQRLRASPYLVEASEGARRLRFPRDGVEVDMLLLFTPRRKKEKMRDFLRGLFSIL